APRQKLDEQPHQEAADDVDRQRAPRKRRAEKAQRREVGEMPQPRAERAAQRDEKKMVHRCCPRSRSFHRFTETAKRSISLFLRNSGRKTASHFSWNCSICPAARASASPTSRAAS